MRDGLVGEVLEEAFVVIWRVDKVPIKEASCFGEFLFVSFG